MSECGKHPQWQPQGLEWKCPYCVASKPATKATAKPTRYSGNRDKRILGRQWMDTIQRIRQRDGYLCRSCGTAVRTGEVDHIKPLDQGGSNDDSNLQLLCDSCHVDKTNKDNGYKVKRRVGLDGIPDGW